MQQLNPSRHVTLKPQMMESEDDEADFYKSDIINGTGLPLEQQQQDNQNLTILDVEQRQHNPNDLTKTPGTASVPVNDNYHHARSIRNEQESERTIK